MRVLKKALPRLHDSEASPRASTGADVGLSNTARTIISLVAVVFILSAIAFNTVLALRQTREQNQSLRTLQTSGQVKRDLDQLQQMMLDEHGDLYTVVSTRAFYKRADYAFPLVTLLELTADARGACRVSHDCNSRFDDLDSMLRKLAERSNDIAQRVTVKPGSVKLDDPALGEIDAYFYAVLEKVVEVRMNADASIDTTVSRASTDSKHVSIALFASAFVAAALLIALLLWNARIAARLRHHQEKLRHQARYDALTALPNRTLLEERLTAAISRTYEVPTCICVLFIDLDRFKQVNDSLGHTGGDELLVQMSARLQQVTQADDVVARYGGDEFIVVAKRSNVSQISQLLDRITQSMDEPLYISEQELFIEASIGVSNYPADGADADTLIRNADAAMYLAKSQGRNGYRFYQADLNRAATEKLNLSMRLRRAVKENRLNVVYQPQMDMTTGRMLGAEALLRWSDEELGIVSPAVFIPIAEDTGLIKILGEFVLRTACKQAQTWREAGLGPIRVSVNVSPIQLAHTDFPRVVRSALDEAAWPADMLELEVTEGALMRNADEAARALRELRDLGVKIAIDDFGTGYSSLSYLKRFSIDRIKIDRAFVQEIGRDSEYEALTLAVIAIAGALKFDVIAEGVENDAHRGFLIKHGCAEGQGFLYSPGVSGDQISMMLLDTVEALKLR
jgi:diguanylate cyclase (GGDEF)-like protein